jgi:hypothetical protein
MSEDSNDATWEATTTILGSAIISWSHCEEATEHLLRDQLQFHGLEEDTARLISSTLDLRSRCALGIALAYKLHPPRKVIDQLSTAVNTVQNELRTARNRLFHDSWMFNKGAIHKRLSTGPRLSRPQAQELELVIPEYSPVNMQEVIDFSKKCIELSREIHEILGVLLNQYAQAKRKELGEQFRGRRTGLIHRLRQIFGKRAPQPPTSPE